MFIYGVRCAPTDLELLPPGSVADYCLDYGLLIFPSYTTASGLNAHGNLNADFWQRARLMMQFPNKPHCEAELEHPWITDQEFAMLQALREFYPGLSANWYYVPRARQATDDGEPKPNRVASHT